MRSILILLGSKIIIGIFGLLLFHIIRKILLPQAYIDFSNFYAMVMLVTTVSGGAISGLMLKKAFTSKDNRGIVQYWSIFFLLVSVMAVEVLIFFGWISSDFRLHAHCFAITQFFMSVALVDYQIKHRFVIMSLIDFSRIIIPLLILILVTELLKNNLLEIGHVLWLIVLGNVFGIYYMVASIGFAPIKKNSFEYLRLNWKSDLVFSFWFAAFNGIAQSLIAIDRKFIDSSYPALLASRIAYTADQTTKIVNGVLFPINTKVSSELGLLISRNKRDKFRQLVAKSTILTFALGMILLFCLLLGMLVADFYNIDTGMNRTSLIFYVLASTLYLSFLISQKSFDYTRLKFLPSVLLFFSILVGIIFVKIISKEIPLYFVAILCYGFLLIICLVKGSKLNLNN